MNQSKPAAPAAHTDADYMPLPDAMRVFGLPDTLQLYIKPQEAVKPPLTIAVEGNIGVGKSVLCTSLAQTYSIRVMKEEVPRPLLRAFYRDPTKHGFSLQMWMIQQRLHQAHLLGLRKYSGEPALPKPLVIPARTMNVDYGTFSVAADAKGDDASPALTEVERLQAEVETLQAELERVTTKKPERTPLDTNVQLWDRSILGDFLFAVANHHVGSLTDDEFNLYYELATGKAVDVRDIGSPVTLMDHLPIFRGHPTYDPETAPRVFVFLVDSPEECKKRAEQRGNQEEQTISLDYFQLIDGAHTMGLLYLLANRERLMGPDGRVIVLAHAQVRDKPQYLLERLTQPASEDCGVQFTVDTRRSDIEAVFLKDRRDDVLVSAVNPTANELRQMLRDVPKETRTRHAQIFVNISASRGPVPYTHRFALNLLDARAKTNLCELLATNHDLTISYVTNDAKPKDEAPTTTIQPDEENAEFGSSK